MSILCLVSHFSCHFHSLYCCCAWRSQGAELLTIHWRKSQPLCCMMQLYFQTGVECPCDDAFSLPSFWTSTHLKHLLWMWVPWCGHSFCALSYIDGKKTGWWEGIDGCKNMENGLSKEVVYECFSSTIILCLFLPAILVWCALILCWEDSIDAVFANVLLKFQHVVARTI